MGHGSEKPTEQSLQFFSQDQAKRNPQDDRKRNTITTLETMEFVKRLKDHPILVARDLRSRNQPRKVRREHVDDFLHRPVTSTTSCR